MDSHELSDRIRRSLELLMQSSDELRDLDQALGDGDLGVTITAGSKAVIAALEELDESASPSEIARASAKAFANANPSTMAALVAGALLAGSRTWSDTFAIDVADAHSFIAAGAANIAQRGKTEVGDKTILDGLAAITAVLERESTGEAAAREAVIAAHHAVEHTKGLQSRRGRASWLQERSIGLKDPGAVALLRFAEAWHTTGVAIRS